MLRYAALLSMVLLAPTVAAAQQMDTLSVGTRIRATSNHPRADRWVGAMAGLHGDTLLLSTDRGDVVVLRLEDLDMLEVSRGVRPRTLQGLGLGLVAGALTGAAIGAAVGQDEFLGPQVYLLLGAGVGAAGGAVIGAAIGAGLRSERWDAAPGWELSLALPPSGRGLGLSLRF